MHTVAQFVHLEHMNGREKLGGHQKNCDKRDSWTPAGTDSALDLPHVMSSGIAARSIRLFVGPGRARRSAFAPAHPA
jgi:hypothetical protein